MELTTKQIVNAQPALKHLGGMEFKFPHAHKVVYNLSDAIEKTDPIAERYNNNMQRLMKAYRVPDGSGGFIIPPENEEEFNTEIQALLDKVEDVDIRPIVLPAPPDEKPYEITPLDRYRLRFMLTIEGEQ